MFFNYFSQYLDQNTFNSTNAFNYFGQNLDHNTLNSHGVSPLSPLERERAFEIEHQADLL